MRLSKNILAILFATTTIIGCKKEEIVNIRVGLDDWSTATHGSTTPNYTQVFNDDVVQTLKIVISADNWAAMESDMETIYGARNSNSVGQGGGAGGPGGGGPGRGAGGNIGAPANDVAVADPKFVECSVYYNGKQWYNVGVRYKGNSSLKGAWYDNSLKIPFKLNFDYFENSYPEIQNQTFYGFDQLALSTNYNDDALIREKVTGDTYRNWGIRAPKSSFYKVYVDYGQGEQYAGLYTFVEVINDNMLADQFGSEAGNCYKPEDEAAKLNSLSYSTLEMEKKNNEAAANYSDIDAFLQALLSNNRTTNPTVWKNELEATFDVDYFLKWIAANTVMQNWDTYGIYAHNYYMYNHNGKLTWIPWDNNECLGDFKNNALPLDMSTVTNEFPLIRYVMDVPAYETIYKNYCKQFVATSFEPSRMKGEFQKYHSLVTDAVNAEQTGATWLQSKADFTAALTYLETHVDLRKAAVDAY